MKQSGLSKPLNALAGVLVLTAASFLIHTTSRAADPTDSERASAQWQQRAGDRLCGLSKAVAYLGFRHGQNPDHGNGAVYPSDQ
jgi:hypothetical protein